MFSFKRIAKSGPQDEASLQKLIAETEARETEIKERLGVIAERRLVYLRDDNDAALDRDDKENSELHRDLDKAGLALADLRDKLEEARAKAADDARLARYTEAQQLSKAAQAALRTYPEAARRIIGILRQTALAEQAIANANSDLPKGKAPLPGAEMSVRGLPRTQRQELGITYGERELHFVTGGPVAELHTVVETKPDGTVIIRGHRGHEYECRWKRKTVTTFKQGLTEYTPSQIATTLSLPPLLPGEHPFWTPIPLWGDGDPARLLAYLDEMEQAARPAPSDPRGLPMEQRVAGVIDADAAPVASPPEVI